MTRYTNFGSAGTRKPCILLLKELRFLVQSRNRNHQFFSPNRAIIARDKTLVAKSLEESNMLQ
ncbi:MAG TPA: hypothetical protein VN708_16205 [Terriglobales bacterium]|nr:hypothetical protein [Terriglobales bacterium]